MVDIDDTLVPVPPLEPAGPSHEGAGVGMVTPEMAISLADLLPDANGEIVVLSAGEPLQLSIVTEHKVFDAGTAGSHQTADGVDVTGLNFVTLEGGPTLYFPSSVELSIAPPAG